MTSTTIAPVVENNVEGAGTTAENAAVKIVSIKLTVKGRDKIDKQVVSAGTSVQKALGQMATAVAMADAEVEFQGEKTRVWKTFKDDEGKQLFKNLGAYLANRLEGSPDAALAVKKITAAVLLSKGATHAQAIEGSGASKGIVNDISQNQKAMGVDENSSPEDVEQSAETRNSKKTGAAKKPEAKEPTKAELNDKRLEALQAASGPVMENLEGASGMTLDQLLKAKRIYEDGFLAVVGLMNRKQEAKEAAKKRAEARKANAGKAKVVPTKADVEAAKAEVAAKAPAPVTVESNGEGVA